MDQVAETAATRMMRSALFGQLIILIVYFPILALSGIEGKMFRPMALTVSFAIMGAMLLSLDLRAGRGGLGPAQGYPGGRHRWPTAS